MPLQGKNEVQHAAVERINLAAVGIDVYGGDTGAVLMPQGGGLGLHLRAVLLFLPA